MNAPARLRNQPRPGEHTLQEVGDRFGCTKENIRLIETKALGKVARALSKILGEPVDLESAAGYVAIAYATGEVERPRIVPHKCSISYCHTIVISEHRMCAGHRARAVRNASRRAAERSA